MGKAALLKIFRNEYRSISVDGPPTVLGDRDLHKFNDDCSDMIEVEIVICGAESRVSTLVSQLLIDQIYIRQEESFEIV